MEKIENLKHREWILVNCEETPQEEVTTSCSRGCVSEFCEMTIPGPQLSIWPVQLANTSYTSSDLVGEQALKTLLKNNYENKYLNVFRRIVAIQMTWNFLQKYILTKIKCQKSK